MVRITSNGDIVDDNDIDVQRRQRFMQSDNDVSLQRSNNVDVANRDMHTPVNAWSMVNARLTEYGIPTYSLYGYKFEPIHFIFTIAAVILFGVQSLLLIPILLIVTNLSASSGTSTNAPAARSGDFRRPSSATGDVNRSEGTSSGPFSGRGHRLGR